MKLHYREAILQDAPDLSLLALKSWSQFRSSLTEENWKQLEQNLTSIANFEELIRASDSIICHNDNDVIIGMAFIVPSGNPTAIFDADWSYIRYVSVDPDYRGQGIGRELTIRCIDLAIAHSESHIALHTSEMMQPAISLYENLGFEQVRELPSSLGKRYWLYMLKL